MSRIDQINDLLQKEVSEFLTKNLEAPDFLATVVWVECSPDLKNVKVKVSVLPDNRFGTALHNLRKISSQLSNHLKKQTRLRKIPKFIWEPDFTEKKASQIDEILKQIKNENPDA